VPAAAVPAVPAAAVTAVAAAVVPAVAAAVVPAVAAAVVPAVPWSNHSGALKYFRDRVLTGEVPSKVLTTDEQVQRVVHGLRQNYAFGEWGQWDWRSFVAAMSPEDRERLFEGHEITAVAVERRAGSYDHHMAMAAKENHWIHYCEELVDFAFRREDGNTVLVHPRWRKKGCGFDFLMKPLEPSQPVPIIPNKGRGKSDGKGTYVRVTSAAYSADSYGLPAAAAAANSSAVAAAAGSSAVGAAASISAAPAEPRLHAFSSSAAAAASLWPSAHQAFSSAAAAAASSWPPAHQAFSSAVAAPAFSSAVAAPALGSAAAAAANAASSSAAAAAANAASSSAAAAGFSMYPPIRRQFQ
jgi:hypothetical protein